MTYTAFWVNAWNASVVEKSIFSQAECAIEIVLLTKCTILNCTRDTIFVLIKSMIIGTFCADEIVCYIVVIT